MWQVLRLIFVYLKVAAYDGLIFLFIYLFSLMFSLHTVAAILVKDFVLFIFLSVKVLVVLDGFCFLCVYIRRAVFCFTVVFCLFPMHV